MNDVQNPELLSFILSTIKEKPNLSRREVFAHALSQGFAVSLSCVIDNICKLQVIEFLHQTSMVVGSRAKGVAKYRYYLTDLGEKWLKSFQDSPSTVVVLVPETELTIQSIVTTWSCNHGRQAGHHYANSRRIK